MPLSEIPGYSALFNTGWNPSYWDFDMVCHLEFERHYQEQRNMVEGNLNIVLQGRGGVIGIRLSNLQGLEIRNFTQWQGFTIDDIRSSGWDRKYFKMYCLESDAVLGYAETAELYKPMPYR